MGGGWAGDDTREGEEEHQLRRSTRRRALAQRKGGQARRKAGDGVRRAADARSAVGKCSQFGDLQDRKNSGEYLYLLFGCLSRAMYCCTRTYDETPWWGQGKRA